MADRKISDLTALTTPASGDYLPIVDISEAAAASKNKRITIEELMRGVPDGTAAAPGIAFETYPSTGIYSSGANQLAGATNGTGRLFVDASGNVGIGISPAYTFHVSSSSTSSAAFRNPGAATTQVLVGNTAGDTTIRTLSTGDGLVFSDTGKYLAFGTNGAAERLRITSAGLVGIGSSAPQVKLHISDLTASAVELMRLQVNLTSPSGNKSITWADSTNVVGRISVDYTSPAAKMRFGSLYNSGYQTSDLMTLTPTGLGIGTTSPAFPLDVNGSVRLPNSAFLNFNNSSGTAQTVLGLFSDNSTYLDAATGGNIIFRPNASAERARLTSDGKFLVGTSTARSNFFNSTYGGIFQVETANNETGRVNTFTYGVANTSGPILAFGKHRSNSVGGTTVAISGDEVGIVSFQASDGTEFVEAGQIAVYVDGTPGANDMPGRLVFSTTADGAATPTERLRINSVGQTMVNSAGSAAAPVISKVDDTNTGIFFPAADTIAFAEGGTEAARIDSSGRLLVGTSTAPVGSTAGSITATNSIFTSGDIHGQYAGQGAITATTGTAVFKFKITALSNNRACFVKLSVFGRGNSTTVTNSPAAEYAFQLHMTNANVMTLNGATSIFEYTFVRATHFAFANLGSGEGTVTITNPVALSLSLAYKIEILNAQAAGTFYLDSVTYA